MSLRGLRLPAYGGKQSVWFIGAILLLAVFLSEGLLFFKKSHVVFFAQNIEIEVEIADETVEWERGLMFREKLDDGAGMLFVSDVELTPVFWMKNMRFPLDLIFISKDKKVVDIKENFQPCVVDQCPTYVAAAPAQYVLEVGAGFIVENKIAIGDVVFIK